MWSPQTCAAGSLAEGTGRREAAFGHELNACPTAPFRPRLSCEVVVFRLDKDGFAWQLDMRWGRGFFRLWLFLSVIWVVASVYLQELRTFEFWRAPILEFEGPSGQKFSINTSKNQNEIAAELNAALGRESRLSGSELEKTRAALLGAIDTAKQITSEEARRAWLATFVPPVAVLGLGLCLGWIFRCSREEKSDRLV